ncbi:MAG: Tol-Pal system protein TolB [Gallionellaceae bacterium]|nr:MAG: Tol-Pal system protein TolB [Gallionellaceae bacterium]
MSRLCSLIVLLCMTFPAHAVLDIEVTGAGEHQVPIAIVPFGGEESLDQHISEVVANDLIRTGLFKLVDPAGNTPHDVKEVKYADWTKAEALVIGKIVKQADGRLEIQFRLLDTVKKTELIGQAVSAKSEQARAIGHRIADAIYENLTGSVGVFSTRIAYVNRQGRYNRLVIADSDGYGEQTLLALNQPIMSPAWSPDGNALAYVSFEQGRAFVYAQSLLTQKRVLLAAFPGSNSAPAWSPDGQQLALVLTHEGTSQIYLVRSDGSNLRRISFSDTIDTEPTFSPDGRYLLFTSDRGGSAQIYRMPVSGGSAERLTFEGSNNFSPRFSPDGKSFVFAHFNGGIFYIAVQDFETKQIQILTPGGWEKKPSFSPNGKLILFATEVHGRGILATVSSDGRVKQKMTPQQGDIREPTWGPFNRQ